MTAKELLERYASCGRDFREANLSGANLREADLCWADLSGADLRGTDLSGAKLRGAILRKADLSEANLSGADLRGAKLCGANLYRADFYGASSFETNFYMANLSEAKNIHAYGPAPSSGRMVYFVRHESGWMVQAGCFWGNLDQLAARLRAGHNSPWYLGLIQLHRSL